jgi:hypothetical protein
LFILSVRIAVAEFMEIDFSDQIKKKESKAVVEQDPCVQYSCAISNLIREKTANHNKDYPECKVKFDQLKKVFVNAARNYEKNEDESFLLYSLTRVNAFLNLKTKGAEKGVYKMKINSDILELELEVSDGNVNLAEKDIEENELSACEAESIDDLWFEEEKTKDFWFEG